MFNNLTTYLGRISKTSQETYNICFIDKMSMTAENTTWPMPKFYFSVDFGSTLSNIPFQEVSGLEREAQIIEYRHSSSPLDSTIKMPGIVRVQNITLKKGVFLQDDHFWVWYNQIKMNTIPGETVVIKLLSETGAIQMTWTLQNARPTMISAADLKSDENEIAVDTIELASETITITNG